MAVRQKNTVPAVGGVPTITTTTQSVTPSGTRQSPPFLEKQQPEPPPPTTPQIDVPPPATPPPPATTTGYGQYGLEGFNQEKMDSGHSSPKYMIGQTISHFDPSAGITDELLAALNALGLGTFNRTSGDKLTITGDVDPRLEGFTELDLIRNFTGDGGSAWQYLARDPNAPVTPQGGAGGGGGSVDLSGLQTILAALAGGGGQTQGSPGGSNQAPVPGWVRLANGDWVPPDHPNASLARWQEPSTSGGGGVSTGGGSSPFMGDEIRNTIMQLLDTGGGYNQGIIDQRSESLREELERSRSVENATLEAVLADRGLTGAGGDIQARADLSERLGARHATALRDLAAEEAARADQRLIAALQTGAGMTIQEAQQAIDWFNAQTGRAGQQATAANNAADIDLRRLLGIGNLGLGQAQLAADYALGQGRLGLDAERLGIDQQNAWLQQMLQLLGIQAGAVPNY